MELCLCMAWRLAFIVGWLMVGLWCAAAALCVLTAAGRLAARLPVLAVHPHLRNTCLSNKHTLKGQQVSYINPPLQNTRKLWEEPSCVTHRLLSSPALAVGEASASAVWFLFCLDDAIFLKLHQTALRIPRLRAENRTRTRRLLVTEILTNIWICNLHL